MIIGLVIIILGVGALVVSGVGFRRAQSVRRLPPLDGHEAEPDLGDATSSLPPHAGLSPYSNLIVGVVLILLGLLRLTGHM